MLIPRLRNDHGELPRLALYLVTLAAVGFSLVLCAQLSFMQLAPRNSYALSNLLGVPGRNLLLSTLAVGLLLPTVLGATLVWRKGSLGLEQLEYWATTLAPLALTFVLPCLFLRQVAETKPLFYLIILSAFGLSARALVAASLRAQSARSAQRPGHTPGKLDALYRLLERIPALHVPRAMALSLVVLAGASYAAYFGHYAVVHHRLIQTVDTDLGITDNLMSNLLQGRSFRSTAQFGSLPSSYLSVHAEYIALLFVPIYRLHPGPETLLWLQAALAGLALVPLFLLSRRLLGQLMALWVSLAYLLLSPQHSALVYGFSWFPAFCLFSFTLYYAVVSERHWLLALALPALLATSEVGPCGVFAFGVFLAISRKKLALGLGLCVLAALVFGFDIRLAMRAGSGAELPLVATGLDTLLHNPVYFVLNLARAAKLSAILHALAPLALLPVASLSSLPLHLPGLLLTSASNEFWPASPNLAQFQLAWVPGGMLSLLFTLRRLGNVPGRRQLFSSSILAMSITVLSHSYDFGLLRGDALGPSKNAQFESTPADDERYANLLSVVRRIPASASVVTTTYMLSHVSSRTDVYDARRPYGKPDYVFFSSRELVGAARTALAATLSTHSYALVTNVDEFYLFRRAAETPDTTKTLRTLGLLSMASPSTVR